MPIMDREQLQAIYSIWMVQAPQKHEGHKFLFLCADAISRREQLTGGWSDPMSMPLECTCHADILALRCASTTADFVDCFQLKLTISVR